MTKTYSHKFKYLFFLIPISFILVSGCDILSSSNNCTKLSEVYNIYGEEMYRYNTQFAIGFNEEVTHQQGEKKLQELGFPFEKIWDRQFVVDTGCKTSASDYYTNYGAENRTSLGDSSFVQYANPVFYYPDGDSDYRLTGKLLVQFDRDLELEFERIHEIADENHLIFRENNPGAALKRYIFIVSKQACCNPLQLGEIVDTLDEVSFTQAMFNFTVPPPDE